jgi:hypothetical protein
MITNRSRVWATFIVWGAVVAFLIGFAIIAAISALSAAAILRVSALTLGAASLSTYFIWRHGPAVDPDCLESKRRIARLSRPVEQGAARDEGKDHTITHAHDDAQHIHHQEDD